MNKAVNYKEIEKKWYGFWEKSDLFKADPDSSKKTYSLLVPPPNLTGELHLGHAMQHSILDAITRFKRLQGFDVLLLPGVDHAGIAFESTFDRKLAGEGLSKEKLGRAEWLKRAWQFKEEVYRAVSVSWRFMGMSADWSREVFTLDEGPQKAVFTEFKTYYDQGLIYKGPYLVQWCPKCNTAIEDVESDYEEKEDKLYYVRYQIAGTRGEYIEVATTRPETIFADTGIAIYPQHAKFKKYIGKKAINPLTGRLLPIFEDKRIDKDFGTGALKITPGHDLLDYEIGKDHQLPIIQVINKTGHLTKLAGKIAGLDVTQARLKSLQVLSEKGALVKAEDYTHSVAVCERCKSVIEPLISEEWFVKVDHLAKEAIRAIHTGKIKFLPKNYAKILIEWLENIHDWCISRSLWWGHRIPVWYRDDEIKVSLNSPGPGWVQEEKVLDTWFSSGLWPMSTLGWPHFVPQSGTSRSKPSIALASESKPATETPSVDPQLTKYYPWDFEISAGEIKYLWIARMIMLAAYFMGEIPFKTMFFHGMLRDLQGRKFSKSLGNGIDPLKLTNDWGTDATRMALYTYSIPGRDGRVSKEILDERAKNYRNFSTKILNIGRFILELKSDKTNSALEFIHSDDKWIKTELEKTVRTVTKNLEEIKLHLATEAIYNFIWHKFADVYLEKSKSRRVEAQPVLEHVLKTSLILLHPFMPFVTEEIYQKFPKKEKSIMLEKWPVSDAQRKTTKD